MEKCDSIVSPSQIIITLDGNNDVDDDDVSGMMYSFKLDINDNLTNSYATVAATTTDASCSPNSSHLFYQHPLIAQQKEHIKLIECCVIL